jgi:hypothetical protein
VIGNLDAEELLQLRASLCWIPVLGGGLGLSWADTGELTLAEALGLGEWAADRHMHELKALFPKGRH